jgi:hypothetical protein
MPIDDFVSLKTSLEIMCKHVKCDKKFKAKITRNLNFIEGIKNAN